MTVGDYNISEEELQYIITFDSAGKPMKGESSYKLHLPPYIPARNFWSVIVYDIHSRLIIQTDQKWPSVYSNSRKLLKNPDDSVDILFGSEAPDCHESNWIKTIPGKGWKMILRLYSPTELWFDKGWRPCEIEEIKQPA